MTFLDKAFRTFQENSRSNFEISSLGEMVYALPDDVFSGSRLPAFNRQFTSDDPDDRLLASAGMNLVGKNAQTYDSPDLQEETSALIAQLNDDAYPVRLEVLKAIPLRLEASQPLDALRGDSQRSEEYREIISAFSKALPFICQVIEHEPGSDWTAVEAATSVIGQLPEFTDTTVPELLRQIKLGKHAGCAFTVLENLVSDGPEQTALSLLFSGDVGLQLSASQHLLGIVAGEPMSYDFAQPYLWQQGEYTARPMDSQAHRVVPTLIRIASMEESDPEIHRLNMARGFKSFYDLDGYLSRDVEQRDEYQDSYDEGDAELPGRGRVQLDALRALAYGLQQAEKDPKARRSFSRAVAREACSDRLLELTDDPHEEIQQLAVIILGYGSGKNDRVVNDLMRKLSHSPLEVSVTAGESLARLGIIDAGIPERVLDSVEFYHQHMDESDGESSIYDPYDALFSVPALLAQYGALVASEEQRILRLLENEDIVIREIAAQIVTELGDNLERGGEALFGRLQSDNSSAAFDYVRGLGQLRWNPDEAVPLLIEIADQRFAPTGPPEPDDYFAFNADVTATHAVRALGEYGGSATSAIPLLRKIANSLDFERSREAQVAIQYIEEEQ